MVAPCIAVRLFSFCSTVAASLNGARSITDVCRLVLLLYAELFIGATGAGQKGGEIDPEVRPGAPCSQARRSRRQAAGAVEAVHGTVRAPLHSGHTHLKAARHRMLLPST